MIQKDTPFHENSMLTSETSHSQQVLPGSKIYSFKLFVRAHEQMV